MSQCMVVHPKEAERRLQVTLKGQILTLASILALLWSHRLRHLLTALLEPRSLC